jgi:hypothetical protein
LFSLIDNRSVKKRDKSILGCIFKEYFNSYIFLLYKSGKKRGKEIKRKKGKNEKKQKRKCKVTYIVELKHGKSNKTQPEYKFYTLGEDKLNRKRKLFSQQKGLFKTL